MRSRWADRARHEQGSATAELAVALPAVAVVLALCLGGVQVVGAQVRMTDAAADAARALGRGEPEGNARSIARAVAGPSAVSTSRDGQFVCVSVSSDGGPFAAFGIRPTGRACALEGGR
jgi:Flp pilus assembly protein TadG